MRKAATKIRKGSLATLNSAMPGEAQRVASVADSIVDEQEFFSGEVVPVTEGKRADLVKLLGAVNRAHGAGSLQVLTGENVQEFNVQRWSTGSPALDHILGGGMPEGRVVEAFGPESGGKTSLCLMITGHYQKTHPEKLAAFVDAEHAYSPEYGEVLGVDNSRLLFNQPDTGEDALGVVETLVRSGVVGLITVDSVASLVPKEELEAEPGKVTIGLQARLMSTCLRRLCGLCSQQGVTVLFVNQVRMKIGVMFGNPETTPGGNALKFYSSLRLEVRRGAAIKVGEEHVGNVVYVKAVKNKTAPPFRSATLDLHYATGFDTIGELVDIAVAKGIVQKAGSWYTLGDMRLGQGRDNVRELLLAQPDLRAEIVAAVGRAG